MDIILKRFDELDAMAEQVAKTLGIEVIRKPDRVWMMGKPRGRSEHVVETVDKSLFSQWRVSVLTLLEQVFGPAKVAYREFSEFSSSYRSTAQFFHGLVPIFRSAKADYEGGYLFDIRNLVHAEVFSDELEQSKHFLDLDHKIPAAVIAGTVLETILRKICDVNGVSKKTDNGKNKMADAMISDLAKISVFNKMRADQLRAWVKVRNSAAHGHPEEFDEGDVERMIDGIRDFVAAQLS